MPFISLYQSLFLTCCLQGCEYGQVGQNRLCLPPNSRKSQPQTGTSPHSLDPTPKRGRYFWDQGFILQPVASCLPARYFGRDQADPEFYCSAQSCISCSPSQNIDRDWCQYCGCFFFYFFWYSAKACLPSPQSPVDWRVPLPTKLCEQSNIKHEPWMISTDQECLSPEIYLVWPGCAPRRT